MAWQVASREMSWHCNAVTLLLALCVRDMRLRLCLFVVVACRLNRDNHALHPPAVLSAMSGQVEVSVSLQVGCSCRCHCCYCYCYMVQAGLHTWTPLKEANKAHGVHCRGTQLCSFELSPAQCAVPHLTLFRPALVSVTIAAASRQELGSMLVFWHTV
jgi:hypothetical protein